MLDKELLCVHCVDQYLLDKIEGKKIYKDQCMRCYEDPVKYLLFLNYRDLKMV